MKCNINSSGYDCSKPFVGGYSRQAAEKRQAILTAPNTEELYEIKGNRYYISKTMSLSEIPQNLCAGDAVLFERGGLWRVGCKEEFSVPEGVIFGAYGVGEKPKFYGSLQNYAECGEWQKETENLWKLFLPGGNVGMIVFDETAVLGVKKWTLEEVSANYDYYHDVEEHILYLYYDGDLTADFSDIEIGQRGDILRICSGGVADNLCVRYTGSHGIAIGGGSTNFNVTNCEVGFIGGSQQFRQVRFGNGIEMQLGVKNAIIKNNWVYQCYDAGITFQSWSSAHRDTYYENLDISENLIEFCYYGLEFFTTDESQQHSELNDISVRANIFRFSGYVWSYEQRPDHWMNAHIRCGQGNFFPFTKNFTFTDNVFDCSRANIVFWWWHDVERGLINPNPHPGVSAGGNSYYQAPMPDKRCMTYFEVDPVFAEDIDGLNQAARRFDPSPKTVEWVEKLG